MVKREVMFFFFCIHLSFFALGQSIHPLKRVPVRTQKMYLTVFVINDP